MSGLWKAFPVASLFATLVLMAVADANHSPILGIAALVAWFVCFRFWYKKTYIKPSGKWDKLETGEPIPTKEELLQRIADLGKVKNHKK